MKLVKESLADFLKEKNNFDTIIYKHSKFRNELLKKFNESTIIPWKDLSTWLRSITNSEEHYKSKVRWIKNNSDLFSLREDVDIALTEKGKIYKKKLIEYYDDEMIYSNFEKTNPDEPVEIEVDILGIEGGYGDSDEDEDEYLYYGDYDNPETEDSEEENVENFEQEEELDDEEIDDEEMEMDDWDDAESRKYLEEEIFYNESEDFDAELDSEYNNSEETEDGNFEKISKEEYENTISKYKNKNTSETEMASLDTTMGMGSMIPPTSNSNGSADKWDTEDNRMGFPKKKKKKKISDYWGDSE